MTMTFTAVLAPLERSPRISRSVLWRCGSSWADLRESDGRATGLNLQLDFINEAGHHGEPPTVIGVDGPVHHGHHKASEVADREGHTVLVSDDAQVDQSALIRGAVANRVGDRLIDREHEVVATVCVQTKFGSHIP